MHFQNALVTCFWPSLLQLHTSLRPHELAGNMHEDIWYCQRILRLPLPAWWLNLRLAVRRRQSGPSTKLSLAANLNTKSGQYQMYICTYQENYWELRSLSAARRSVTWHTCSWSPPCDSPHTLTRLCNANDFLQYHFMSTSCLHSSTRHRFEERGNP